MANTYKNIVITPNRSSNTADPKVVYSGGNTTTNTDITLYVYPDSNGTLSWEGNAGQLFSITNDLSNNLFGVNDVSGIPYIEVYANGFVSLAPFGGNVVIGNTAKFILSSATGLSANGSFGTAGQALTTNGSAVYWSTIVGTNTSAQYTWTNTHTFQNTVTFSSLVNASSLNVVNQTNTTTLFVTTSANIASSNVIANTAGVFVANSTGVVNAAVHSVGTSFIANTTQVTISGIPLSANGGVGTAGQVLTTNGSAGAPYWSTVSGVNTSATYTWTNTHTFQNTVIFNSNVLVRNTATTYVGNTTGNGSVINLYVYPDSNGTLSWEGNAGQLFSITNDLSNNLFGVNDVSGIPYIEVYANGFVSLIPFGGNVVFGNTTSGIIANTSGLYVATSTGVVNSAVHSVGSSFIANSTGVYHTGTVNAASHTTGATGTGTGGLIANVTTLFIGNNTINSTITSAGLTVNGTAVIANSSGVTTTGFVNAVSSVNSASHTTGGTGTGTGGLVANTTVVFIGNNTINAQVNTTTLYIGGNVIANSTGANNAFNLGGTAAAGYQTTAGLSANVATLSANNASYLGGTAAASYQLNSTLNANIASYLPTYTGVVNGSSHTVGTAFTANATVVNAVSYYAGTTLIGNTTGPYGKTEGSLNVNNATTAYGKTEGNLNVNSAIYANSSITNTFTVGTGTYFVAGGNVGIGNSSPDAKLAVTGTANVSGNVAIAGISTFTANVQIGNSSVYPHIISNFGYSNPNTFGVGTLTTNAALNTLLVGPYTIASGNSLVITTGSRVVIV